MKNIYQKGKDAFNSGLCCAESVLTVVSYEQNIESDLIPSIATGFCSGMARTCNMCGAVSGGIISLNLYHNKFPNPDRKEKLYKDINVLIERFETKFGTSNCKQLLDCDLATEKGQSIFNKLNLGSKCSEFVGTSAQIVNEIIKQKV